MSLNHLSTISSSSSVSFLSCFKSQYPFQISCSSKTHFDPLNLRRRKAMNRRQIAWMIVFILISKTKIKITCNVIGLGASFIFGDSLVDAGNNNYLTGLSKANTPPNGIDFKASGGMSTGRYTNGRIISDIVGEELGQPNYALPYLSLKTTTPEILNGVNYASGGGGLLNSTGRLFGPTGRISMEIQVDFFNKTRAQLDELLGPKKAKEMLRKDAIFSITIGSNDFLNNYLIPVVSIGERLSESPEVFVNHLISNLKQQLNRLHRLDARKFLVANVGPLGCIPYQRTLNRVNSGECAALPNQLVTRYNDKLRELMTELNRNLDGATFLLANVYDLVMDIIVNYAQYGFISSSKACCGDGGQYQGLIPCGPASTLCDERSRYVFWDPYHPSEATNLIVAKKLVDGNSTYISPMNVRQLRYL